MSSSSIDRSACVHRGRPSGPAFCHGYGPAACISSLRAGVTQRCLVANDMRGSIGESVLIVGQAIEVVDEAEAVTARGQLRGQQTEPDLARVERHLPELGRR